jgi:hypothetical protein
LVRAWRRIRRSLRSRPATRRSRSALRWSIAAWENGVGYGRFKTLSLAAPGERTLVHSH